MAVDSQLRGINALSESVVDSLLHKLQARGRQPLVDPDYDALLGIVETWAHLTEVAASASANITEIRRLLGIRKSPPPAHPPIPAPEDVTAEAPELDTPDAGESDNNSDDEEKPQGRHRDKHGRRHADEFGTLPQAYHPHTLLKSGDCCPGCLRGRMYKYRPSVFTTISGRAPLVATRHTLESLRCNACSEVYRAPLPATLEDDGVDGRTLYAYSAVAMVAIYRCFGGMPMHRQQSLQKALGVHVPDASIWDMCERLADIFRPLRHHLLTLASNARLFYGDDTGATILNRRSQMRVNRRTGEEALRTGCHTTCIIAMTDDAHPLTLFFTGIHHTGEIMDLVLGERQVTEPPVFMSDCVAANTVSQAVVLYAGCNAHAVRRFKALVERYPEECGQVLERYGKIYDHESYCVGAALSADDRRDYHEHHSRPLLRQITEYGEGLFEKRTIEPNSDLGEALSYVINNERRLSAFCRHPHAPLDNNACERELRICVRLRESARFFRNAIGAGVADTLLSVGATAMAADENLFDYFVAAQRHASDVRTNPESWLPWRYRARVADLTRTNSVATGPPKDATSPS